MAKTNSSYSGGVRGDARAIWLSTNRDAAKVLDGYILKAEELFKSRIAEAGLVLTSEMLSSFRTFAAEEGDGFVQARLRMSALVRISDMRDLNYPRTPPLAAMERFVELTGVNKFPIVPGYPTKNLIRPASETATIERIAWGIKMNRARNPNVKRGYRGIYSDPLLQDVLPYLFRDLFDAANLTAVRGFKLLFSES
ncbi:hypothetical protein F5984_19860 [Rudanella paleaurantiibacter]|uniref:Uncharacterized protein n=1 Tax=Rudanella paleaurantiibacter TaxID=2614655 RepID=A0A7J5TVQ2_9BACT|nr:hypothetical protein [Rudanella paleaurantiibacter]KAB7728013.1 hypothetical protein F5984_19860 [Rudanella paleaurantiibacter]